MVICYYVTGLSRNPDGTEKSLYRAMLINEGTGMAIWFFDPQFVKKLFRNARNYTVKSISISIKSVWIKYHTNTYIYSFDLKGNKLFCEWFGHTDVVFKYNISVKSI